MVKKEYVVPCLEVVEMECVSILAGSFTEGSDEIDKNDPNDQGTNKKNDFLNHTWE